ncbi:hypothetical protein MLD38_015258 [Melastoma candidum]|uniref:Uncharacterized protein n=1 Tax=Melastoma candidum TaxID=119954 RepID=A0ACB9RFL6_9MYRT|nr:hypothetical protein MLD38_015258 [Melastoma candidum]
MGWAAFGKLTARPCDNCGSAAAAVFCKADSAFLCLRCDSAIHGANKLSSRHQRTWMCEVCERAPAALACKADAAVLCVSCDSDIHSANPLASRHERFPVEPFYDAVEPVTKVAGISFLSAPGSGGAGEAGEEEEVATSWLLPNPSENSAKKGRDLPVFDEMDPSLRFQDENSIDRVATDGLVPSAGMNTNQGLRKGFDIDFSRSKISPLIYEMNPDQSLSHSASSSSHDFGVVPDGTNSKGSETSYLQTGSLSRSTTTDLSNTNATVTMNQATRLHGMDREARVMRYREKRKNRKFEKTIRYASRKAYAEARPRIKGRFVKQREAVDEAENDSVCGASPGNAYRGNEYSIVPTF